MDACSVLPVSLVQNIVFQVRHGCMMLDVNCQSKPAWPVTTSHFAQPDLLQGIDRFYLSTSCFTSGIGGIVDGG